MNFDGLTLATMLAAAGAMALGSAFQAALGMGVALMAAPLLALLDPAFVPGPMLLAATLLAALMAYGEREALDQRMLGISYVGLAAGTVAGAFVLQALGAAHLERVIGAVILVAVALSLFGVSVAANARGLLAAGGASGVMGVLAGLHGPAISLAFQHADPKKARAMLGAYFTVAYLSAVAALALVGSFGAPELARTVVLLPGVVIGFATAPLARRYVDRRVLRAGILGVAAVSGLILLVK